MKSYVGALIPKASKSSWVNLSFSRSQPSASALLRASSMTAAMVATPKGIWSNKTPSVPEAKAAIPAKPPPSEWPVRMALELFSSNALAPTASSKNRNVKSACDPAPKKLPESPLTPAPTIHPDQRSDPPCPRPKHYRCRGRKEFDCRSQCRARFGPSSRKLRKSRCLRQYPRGLQGWKNPCRYWQTLFCHRRLRYRGRSLGCKNPSPKLRGRGPWKSSWQHHQNSEQVNAGRMT